MTLSTILHLEWYTETLKVQESNTCMSLGYYSSFVSILKLMLQYLLMPFLFNFCESYYKLVLYGLAF